jgi:hypothetical protein
MRPVETLEESEDTLGVLRRKADAVIASGYDPFAVHPFRLDVDLRRMSGPAVFPGIREKIQEDIRELFHTRLNEFP